MFCVCGNHTQNIAVHISAVELSVFVGASRHVTQHGAYSHVILSIYLLQCEKFLRSDTFVIDH